jgi:uncharacterized phage protein (TIGR02218 family)
MTTYENNMSATQQLALPELYHFQQGFENAYYTSFHSALTFKNETYIPRPIKRGDFKYDSNLGTVSLTITAAVVPELGQYIAQYPLDRTTVTIYRAVEDDLTEYAVIFEGQIVTVGFENHIATAKLEQKASILGQELDLVVYQPTCNHHVFDGRCRLDHVNWVVPAIVTVSGSSLLSDQVSGYADGYFTGGEVHFGQDARLITNHTGNNLALHIPFDSRLQSGATVDVYPGCDGQADTCIDKFDNYDNFLGMPFIPSKNPAVWGV